MESIIDNAIRCYLDCKVPLYATRSSMFFTELFKDYRLYREIGYHLIKVGADLGDIACALFLEQAAIAFLQTSPPLPRKYAFHVILAGHRYHKSNQVLCSNVERLLLSCL